MYLAPSAKAEELQPPNIWAVGAPTSNSYAQATTLRPILQEATGTLMSLASVKNNMGGLSLLANRQAEYCLCGNDSFFGQEGIFQFATAATGPQPVRVLLASSGNFGVGLATARDAHITTLKDLKGKRVAWLKDQDAVNRATSSFLAYAGLSWDDVSRVDFPGFNESVDGIINGLVDAAFATTVSPRVIKLAASSRGLLWPPLPANDVPAWKRLNDVAPYFMPAKVTLGAGVSSTHGWNGASHAYPFLLARVDVSVQDAYILTKAMTENIELYQDKTPGAHGWDINKQTFSGLLPFHGGAIQYFKEIGKWTDTAQAHQDTLLRRQAVLKSAFDTYLATKPEEEDFETDWIIARAQSLIAADLPIIFD